LQKTASPKRKTIFYAVPLLSESEYHPAGSLKGPGALLPGMRPRLRTPGISGIAAEAQTAGQGPRGGLAESLRLTSKTSAKWIFVILSAAKM